METPSSVTTAPPPAGKRVGKYARVSLPKQKSSLRDQHVLMDEVIAKHAFVCVAEESDIGSGKRVRKRDGYQRMLQRIKQKEIDILMLTDLSRGGRNPSELFKLADLCRQYEVALWDVRLGGPIAWVYLWALSLVAVLQLDVAIDQIKKAHWSNIKDGLRAGAKAYGYNAVEKDGKRGHLEINSAEAEVVRRIFDLKEKNHTERDIAKILNFGSDPKPAPRGGRWRKESVGVILHNPVYKGIVQYDRTTTRHDVETEAVRHIPTPDRVRSNKGKHDPIVTEKLFDKVQQKRLRPPGTVIPFKRKNRGPSALFSGQIKCPTCRTVDANGVEQGGTMVVCGRSAHGENRLRCSWYATGACTNPRSYFRHEVHASILQGLVAELEDPRVIEAYLKEHAQARKKALESRRQEKSRLTATIAKLDRQIENLKDAIANSGLGPDLKDGYENRKAARAKAQKELEDYLFSTCTFELDPPRVETYLEMIRSLVCRLTEEPQVDVDLELRTEIENLIEKVYVHPRDGRGFEVEVFGKLSNVVKGSTSFRAQLQKSFEPKHMRKYETLSFERASLRLATRLFRRPSEPIVTVFSQLLDILKDVHEPMTGTLVSEMLAEKGIKHDCRVVLTAMKAHPDSFIRVRNGYMLRNNWLLQPLKWFPSTADVVETAQIVLSKGRRAMSLQDILDEFERLGFRLYGHARRVLGDILSRHQRVFENIHLQKGIWRLRAKTKAA